MCSLFLRCPSLRQKNGTSIDCLRTVMKRAPLFAQWSGSHLLSAALFFPCYSRRSKCPRWKFSKRRSRGSKMYVCLCFCVCMCLRARFLMCACVHARTRACVCMCVCACVTLHTCVFGPPNKMLRDNNVRKRALRRVRRYTFRLTSKTDLSSGPLRLAITSGF